MAIVVLSRTRAMELTYVLRMEGLWTAVDCLRTDCFGRFLSL